MSSFRGVPIDPHYIAHPAVTKGRKKRMPFPSKNALLKSLTEARDLTIKNREGDKWEILYYALSICIDIELDSPNSLRHDADRVATAVINYLAKPESK